jgi:hypothetical protein
VRRRIFVQEDDDHFTNPEGGVYEESSEEEENAFLREMMAPKEPEKSCGEKCLKRL